MQYPVIWQTENSGVPAIYNGGLPSEIEPKKIKKPWFNKKIKSIKWNDFFQVEKNNMVVYRIIPHSRVSNNNRRLWKAVHKMYEMYESPGSRLEREGFTLRYREKDYFWFDVVFKQEKGRKKIEFYVSTSEYQAKKLKRKLENKMNVTFKEASLDDLQVPKENTIVQEIKYLKHDIFSINTNSQDTSTPISSILNTVDELQNDGDFARFSICNEVENRQKWVKNAQWAYEKLNKGKVPQRANISGKRMFNASKITIGGIINEINALLTDTFNAFTNVFFKSDKKYEDKKVIEKTFSLEDEINARSISATSREKINQPVFKSRIRVAAHSNDKLTRETMSEILSTSFGELAENNELTGIKIRINGRRCEVIDELNTLKLSTKTKANGNVNLISTDEMSKLALQMPNSDLQRRYNDELNVKKNVETNLPSVLATDKGILVGHAQLKDEKSPISIPLTNLDETFRSYGFVGSPRMGKDTLMKNMIIESCLHHGISTIVLDQIMEQGERGLADGIRDVLPPEKVIDIDCSDEEYFPPLDLTEVVKKLGDRNGADRFANELIDFFGDLEDMGQSRSILRTFAKASQGSIYNIKMLIENEEFRINRIKELKEYGQFRLVKELDKWSTTFKEKRNTKGEVVDIVVDRDGQKALESKASSILNRLEEFLGTDSLFNIFAQDPHEDLDLEKWMSEGKVIIFRIPNRKLGPLPAKTLAHWITLKTFMTKLLMDPNEGKSFIVFNEPHQYLTTGLKHLMQRILLEGPKWRLSAMFAFHHFGLLKYGLDEDMRSAGINWFLFANDNKKVFIDLEEQLKPTFDAELAMQTEAYDAIVISRFNGIRQNPFLMRALAPPSKRYPEYDNSFLTKRHARQFGRHWQDIEKQTSQKEIGFG